MRHSFVKSLIGSSLLVLGLGISSAAAPQRFDRFDNRVNFQDFQDAQTLFHQVRSDLDRADNASIPAFADRSSFDRARGELSALERQWDENEYKPRQVDNVIAALQRVLADNHLLIRDRDRLSEDVGRLRDFLETHQ